MSGVPSVLALVSLLAALIPALHFVWVLMERWTSRRVRLEPRLKAVYTADGRTGIRARISNTGGKTVNTEWVVFETSAARMQLSVDTEPPLPSGRIESWAVSWRELLQHGINREEAIRVRVKLDVDREFVSRWTVFGTPSRRLGATDMA